MTDPRSLHREAMELSEAAVLARRNQEHDAAQALLRQAFRLERSAAESFSFSFETEPTRSVLFRSAATLALDIGETREAERLIALALAGEVPPPIAEELRDLLEAVYFQRHLDLRGIKLEADEFQFTLEGRGIGFGIAPANLFVGRVRDVETLLYRTAERSLNRPFRDRGSRKKSLDEQLQLYVTVPRAASFAVTFRVGASAQIEFPETSFAAHVVSDVIECLDLLNAGETHRLQAHIGDEAYFRNFVALAQNIAPDGEIVKSLGFTAMRNGAERRVSFTRPKRAIVVPDKPKFGPETLFASTFVDHEVEIVGLLLEADGTDAEIGQFQVRTSDGKTEVVLVPRGLMRDIVRPLFDEEVRVTGTRTAAGIRLGSIQPDL
jgi:hypothetical protein